jgi:polyisoprenoid-binding protein YceI
MSRMFAALVLASVVSIANTGCQSVMAQMAPTLNFDTAKIPSGSYQLDASHTAVLFELSHLGFSQYVGRFDSLTGTLSYDAAAPAASKVSIKIDPKSLKSSSSVLDKKLLGSDAFDIEKHPEIRFESTKLTLINATTGTLDGNLTMRGATKPVTLALTFNGGGTTVFSPNYVLGFKATGTLKRSQWGITNWLPLVGDEVKLTIHTEFVKQ